MDILYDMGVSKLSANIFLKKKVNYSFNAAILNYGFANTQPIVFFCVPWEPPFVCSKFLLLVWFGYCLLLMTARLNRNALIHTKEMLRSAS